LRGSQPEAKRLGWDPTKLRYARLFAHPKEGYSGERLAGLCKLLREWSFGELKAEIRRLLGRCKQGGRTRRVSSDPGDVLVQLDGMADTWQRWFWQAADEEGARPILDRLPRSVSDRVREVAGARNEKSPRKSRSP
jgi:hypothetical protein